MRKRNCVDNLRRKNYDYITMEQFSKKVYVRYIDEEINSILKNLPSGSGREYSLCYNHGEEFFLNLDKSFTIPRLPVHHDVTKDVPEKSYIQGVRRFLRQIVSYVPELFPGVVFVFSPENIHKLNFLKLYKIEEWQYLYTLSIDLLYRPQSCEITLRGNNDTTPEYTTRKLFLEAFFEPVIKVLTPGGELDYFGIRQLISETWIGEKGRGYFIQGIWMDDDLTRFFSKLFIPPGKKLYPFYPFVCKNKTICQNLIEFTPGSRKNALPNLHKALQFLLPRLEEIQESLRNEPFDEEMPIFQSMKSKVPSYWQKVWKDVNSKAYLNENDMREFIIEIDKVE